MEAKSTVKLTHADYLLFPDDGQRHELLDGEHYVTAAPRLRHQRISQNLSDALSPFARQHRLGSVFVAPLDVILSDHDVVQPDLMFISNERREIEQDWVRGAPDLVVEILSPSTRARDEGLKRRIYEERGVREYWVVDPEAEAVRIWRFEEDPQADPTHLDREAELTTPLLPELRLPVARIFE